MIKFLNVVSQKQAEIPAVVQIDGTGRLQTVQQDANPLYWKLIKEFAELTGVPVVLNTSFNENEPIVCKPEEAIDCFLRTKMDALAIGNYLIEKRKQRQIPKWKAIFPANAVFCLLGSRSPQQIDLQSY